MARNKFISYLVLKIEVFGFQSEFFGFLIGQFMFIFCIAAIAYNRRFFNHFKRDKKVGSTGCQTYSAVFCRSYFTLAAWSNAPVEAKCS